MVAARVEDAKNVLGEGSHKVQPCLAITEVVVYALVFERDFHWLSQT